MPMKNYESKIEFSIIIPLKEISEGGYIFETCEKIKELTNKNYEVIILPDAVSGDKKLLEEKLDARIIETGNVNPGVKRDIALDYAKGEYLAFIDDDAYPQADWLDVAAKNFGAENVAAIGGPQLTPSDDSFWQKVSGAMFVSFLSGGALTRYWPGEKIEETVDWPTVNLIVKTDAFREIGGFGIDAWPGEDTKLCLKIVKDLKKKILYIPDLIVYHHRRPTIKKHLLQTGRYGHQRGYFTKKYPENSRKMSSMYFMPSLMVLYITLGAIGSFFSEYIFYMFLFGIVVYFLVLVVSAFSIVGKTGSYLVSFMTVPYLVLFHIWYGLRYMQGLFLTKDLNDESK
jgi:cellulose synthase/poly-beta-1,6-N-acetylglucosamine synthase-like glycosyltransferase